MLSAVEKKWDALRAARKKAGLNQEALAGKMGLEQGAISKWETFASRPDTPTLVRVAATLKCSIEDLVVGLDDDYDRQRQRSSDVNKDEPRDPTRHPTRALSASAKKGPADAQASHVRVRELEAHRALVAAIKDVTVRLTHTLTEHRQRLHLDDEDTGAAVPRARAHVRRARA